MHFTCHFVQFFVQARIHWIQMQSAHRVVILAIIFDQENISVLVLDELSLGRIQTKVNVFSLMGILYRF